MKRRANSKSLNALTNAQGQLQRSVIERSIVQTEFPVKIAKVGIRCVVNQNDSVDSVIVIERQRFKLLTTHDVIKGTINKNAIVILDVRAYA